MVEVSGADRASKYAHTLLTLFAVAVTAAILITTMASKKDENSAYLTNSFLSTYYSDVPAVTFAPAGDPFTPSQVSDTYYGCLFKAQVGVNSAMNCKGDNQREHTLCLITKTTSAEYRANRTIEAIYNVLSAYQGDAWNLTALPSFFTTTNITQLGIQLSSADMFQQMVVQLSTSNSIIGIDLREAIAAAAVNLGTPGCLRSVQQGPGILHDISPVYDTLWACTAGIIQTETANHRAYDMCIPQTAWPALDVMQTPYSSAFLGSYNKFFALLIGMWILSSFCVYSVWLMVESPPTLNGKPAFWFARGGKAFTIFATVWNAAAIIIIVVRSFSDPSNANYFPMTVQTVVVTLLFAFLSTVYFGREVWELFAYSDDSPVSSSGRGYQVLPEPGQGNALRYSKPSKRSTLGYFMRVPAEGTAANLESPQYTPLFAPTWNDCWVLCDGLLILGVIGYSQDVVTADLVMCFLHVLASAACSSSLVRLLYHGYINEVPATGDRYTPVYDANKFRTAPAGELAGANKARQGIRVMAMTADIAQLLFSLVFWYLTMFTRYSKSPLIIGYVVCASLLPSVFWLILNLVLDNGYTYMQNSLYYPAQYLFVYNVFIRGLFAAIILADSATYSEDSLTSDTSLLVMLRHINS